MKACKRTLSLLLCLTVLLGALLLPAGAVNVALNELPIIPPHSHTYVYTDNGNGTHTVTCTGCDYSVTESHTYTNGTCLCGKTEQTAQLKIRSASLHIRENVNLVYAASVPEGYTNPYMVFTFLGTTYTVRSYTVDEQGNYCYEMSKTLPQYMGENVSAVLHATKNGADCTDTLAVYSVRQYCANQLANNPSAELKTLLSDLLTYGEAAQQYVGYKTNALVTNGLTLTPSAFPGLSGKEVVFNGTAAAGTDWKSATLVLRSTLAVRFYFRAENVSGLTVRCTMNGSTLTFTDEDFCQETGGESDVYYVELEGIEATDFDKPVTAAFYRSNAQLGRTASYTVNTYICSMQNCADANLRALVRALYNYGASASAYVK